MQRRTPAGVRAEHDVTLTVSPSAAPDPLATTKASHAGMRSVLQDLESRKHSRAFTENDRIRLLRTRAVDGLLTDTITLVKTDAEAVNYLRWRARTADAEAGTMQDRRPSMWFPGRRRTADEQIREKRAMAQEADSFATSIEVDVNAGRHSVAPATAARPVHPPSAVRHPAHAGPQGRVQRGVRSGGEFTSTSHAEAGITLTAPSPARPEPVQPVARPSSVSRAGSDQHLTTLTDFLDPLEALAGRPGFTPAHETQLLRGRRVRRILETATRGTSSDAQVVQNLESIRGQAEGQLRAAEASAPTATDRATLRARIQELREVVKDCGTYSGFLAAGT